MARTDTERMSSAARAPGDPSQPAAMGVWEAIWAGIQWLLANRELLEKNFSVWSRGVTNIKSWANETDQELEVWKYDHEQQTKKDHYKIPAKQTRDNAPMWIPWADNAEQYTKGKRAFFNLGGKPFAYVWQSGPVLRFNVVDEWVAGGQAVPGSGLAGGERRMVVAKDGAGNVGFVIGALPGSDVAAVIRPKDEADFKRLEDERDAALASGATKDNSQN